MISNNNATNVVTSKVLINYRLVTTTTRDEELRLAQPELLAQTD